MATELDIANGALAHLGEPPIADLNGTGARAVACRQHFGKSRDAVLRLKNWNFATSWVQPPQDPADSIGRLKKRFVLPVDCVAVQSVDGLGPDDWAVEGGKAMLAGVEVEQTFLCTNTATPLVAYTRRVVNPALWDALFAPTMEFYLASFIAPQLGRDATLGPALRDEGDNWLADAARRDNQEKAPTTIDKNTSWITARQR